MLGLHPNVNRSMSSLKNLRFLLRRICWCFWIWRSTDPDCTEPPTPTAPPALFRQEKCKRRREAEESRAGEEDAKRQKIEELMKVVGDTWASGPGLGPAAWDGLDGSLSWSDAGDIAFESGKEWRVNSVLDLFFGECWMMSSLGS